MAKAINELSTDTRILINKLTTAFMKDKQDFISYGELSAAIGRDVQNGARCLLATARKHVQKECGVLIRPVIKEGLKLTGDLIGEIDRTSHSIGKKAKRTMSECVNASKDKPLTNEETIGLNARMSQLGAIVLFTKPKASRRLEEAIKNMTTPSEIPTAETLKLFAK